jgi:hypothetical protein
MTPQQIETFVGRFEQAWASRSSEAFQSLWHPEGELHYPFAGRVIKGSEIGLLNEIQAASAPELTWELIHWTARGDVVVVEWECSNRYGEAIVTWRGVDKLTLRDGRIIEEVVYADTAPLQALRRGQVFEPLITLPEANARAAS